MVAENKVDMTDKLVKSEEFQALSNKLNCAVIETSAKTGENISKLYETLIKEFVVNSKSLKKGFKKN